MILTDAVNGAKVFRARVRIQVERHFHVHAVRFRNGPAWRV